MGTGSSGTGTGSREVAGRCTGVEPVQAKDDPAVGVITDPLDQAIHLGPKSGNQRASTVSCPTIDRTNQGMAATAAKIATDQATAATMAPRRPLRAAETMRPVVHKSAEAGRDRQGQVERHHGIGDRSRVLVMLHCPPNRARVRQTAPLHRTSRLAPPRPSLSQFTRPGTPRPRIRRPGRLSASPRESFPTRNDADIGAIKKVQTDRMSRNFQSGISHTRLTSRATNDAPRMIAPAREHLNQSEYSNETRDRSP